MTVLEHLESRVCGFAIELASQVSPEVRILGVDGIPGSPDPFFQVRCWTEHGLKMLKVPWDWRSATEVDADVLAATLRSLN